MNMLKIAGLSGLVYIASLQQLLAATGQVPAVPEIDAAGGIIAIGLVAGLVALIRERFFRK